MRAVYFLLPIALSACNSAGTTTATSSPNPTSQPTVGATTPPTPNTSTQPDPVDITSSGFLVPVSGFIPVDLSNEQNNGTGRTFGSANYVSGFDSTGAVAYAGLADLGDAGAMPSAAVTFSAAWELVGISDVQGTPGSPTGTNIYDSGSFSLLFDPSDNSLTGAGAGSQGILEVNGTVSAGDMDGSVQYEGVPGNLDGILGENGFIGAFHGNSDTMVYGGGIRSD